MFESKQSRFAVNIQRSACWRKGLHALIFPRSLRFLLWESGCEFSLIHFLFTTHMNSMLVSFSLFLFLLQFLLFVFYIKQKASFNLSSTCFIRCFQSVLPGVGLWFISMMSSVLLLRLAQAHFLSAINKVPSSSLTCFLLRFIPPLYQFFPSSSQARLRIYNQDQRLITFCASSSYCSSSDNGERFLMLQIP